MVVDDSEFILTGAWFILVNGAGQWVYFGRWWVVVGLFG